MLNRRSWPTNQKESVIKPDNTIPKGMTHFGFKRVPVDDKVKWVLGHFNTVADKYDLMNTLLSFGIHHLWKRTAIRMLGLRKGDKVIDLCGGTGDLSLLAAKDVDLSGRVILYDINRAMMERGVSKVASSPFATSIFFVQGDAERISFPDCIFDAAIVGFGVRNLTHVDHGLKEIHRVLKPNGKLMCLEFSRPTAPMFRRVYDFYSFYIMPFLGQLIVGSRQAYTYLPESIRMFPLPMEFAHILKRIGFTSIGHRRLTNGIAVVHLAIAKKELA